MQLAQWMCVMAAALVCSAAAAAEPCRLQQLAAIETIIDDAQGTVFVPVNLDGHEGYMALQLSSGLPAIYESYVDMLGLRDHLRRTKWDVEVSGKKIYKEAMVASTTLGHANFTAWSFLIYPQDADDPPTVNGKPMFGVMTSVFMNVVDLELNLSARSLKLFTPNKCKGTPVYWDAEVTGVDLFVDASGLLLFPMEVEGKRLEGSLNTTSRLSVISSEAARRFLGFDESSPGIERESLAGDKQVASFRAMSLTAKGLDVRNSRVRIKKMPRCALGYRNTGAVACGNVLALTPFSIGTDLMRKLRIYVSVADRKIYFTRAEPAGGNSAAVAPGAAEGAPDAAK